MTEVGAAKLRIGAADTCMSSQMTLRHVCQSGDRPAQKASSVWHRATGALRSAEKVGRRRIETVQTEQRSDFAWQRVTHSDRGSAAHSRLPARSGEHVGENSVALLQSLLKRALETLETLGAVGMPALSHQHKTGFNPISKFDFEFQSRHALETLETRS